MNQAKSVVITGGPCSGKTTIIGAIREEFGSRIVIIPEAATLLLSGGFPTPGKDIPWSEKWQLTFQSAIVALQKNMESINQDVARHREAGLIICDRGLMDGAAYTPGGIAEFCRQHQLEQEPTLARYEAIIHLESLATAAPEKYGKANNEHRFETLEEAQALETRTREAWSGHKRHIVLNGRRGIDGKISEVIGMARLLLAS